MKKELKEVRESNINNNLYYFWELRPGEMFWECPVCFQRGRAIQGFKKHYKTHSESDLELAKTLPDNRPYEDRGEIDVEGLLLGYMEMSLDRLKKYLKPLPFKGKITMEVMRIGNGYIINVVDRHKGRFINERNAWEDFDNRTTIFSLYLTEEGVVDSIIEHPYINFSVGNKEQISLVLRLIGKTILLDKGEK